MPWVRSIWGTFTEKETGNYCHYMLSRCEIEKRVCDMKQSPQNNAMHMGNSNARQFFRWIFFGKPQSCVKLQFAITNIRIHFNERAKTVCKDLPKIGIPTTTILALIADLWGGETPLKNWLGNGRLRILNGYGYWRVVVLNRPVCSQVWNKFCCGNHTDLSN